MSEHLLLRQIPGCQQIDLPEPVKQILNGMHIDANSFISDIHVDTLGLSLVCMALILIVLGAIAQNLVADGPGGKPQAMLEAVYKFVADFCSGAIGHDYK